KLQEEKGYNRREAIEEAAALRLRPILMTTAATVVAMVPLLIASGAGAASRFAIGVVIAAGMTIGTLFTLFITPAVYTYLARDHQKAARAAREAAAAAGIPAEAPREATPPAAPASEAHAFSPAPLPASSKPRPAKRPGRRRRLPEAAE
ncbi:MAG TPA: efflux RND transporter permease subunit, partial [Methyloceanibacter sp.]|nr:efflux RND transporter permease subunit [Methyloceanibacter sp.]